MSVVGVRLDARRAIAATKRFLGRHDEMVRTALSIGGDIAKAQVRQNPGFTPRSGRLQKATKTQLIRTRGGRVLRIRNTAPHARPIESGARPHVIRAKGGGLLRFKVGSTVYYRRQVNHPGNRPYRFLSRATGKAHTSLRPILERGMRSVAAMF